MSRPLPGLTESENLMFDKCVEALAITQLTLAERRVVRAAMGCYNVLGYDREKTEAADQRLWDAVVALRKARKHRRPYRNGRFDRARVEGYARD